jgi:plastocyanin
MTYKRAIEVFMWAVAALGAVALGVAILGLNAKAAESDAARIEVKNFMFMPTTLTVKAGDKVTWVNKDEEPHTVTSDTGVFRSGAMDTDGSFSYKFDQPGTYHFTCSIHPRMVGTIVVK